MTTPESGAQVEAALRQVECSPPESQRPAGSPSALRPEFAPVLFGAGALGRFALAGLRKAGIEPLCFADNNPLRWDTSIGNISVLSLAEAIHRFGEDVPIVVCIYTGANLESELREEGLRAISFPQLALGYPNTLLPWWALEPPCHMLAHEDGIRRVLPLWADGLSREEYVAQIRFRCTFRGPLPPHLPAQEIYFPRELVELHPDEVFVDCGAFDGDSVSAFLGRTGGWFRGVVGIEGHPENASKLCQFVSSMSDATASKIEIVQAAVASQKGTVRFSCTGSPASNYLDRQGTIEVPALQLDEVLKGKRPTYIKMDIEGAEADALAGARETIQTHAPVLAICLYHHQSDLWQIPLQIRDMTDRYCYYLRRYSDYCWEEVLYAIPRERVAAQVSNPDI
jgi:FkbM family methyltransferase